MPRLVDVAELSGAQVWFNASRVCGINVLKFVPLTVTDVPATPMLGLKLVMVGAALAATTEKEIELVADPFGEVTAIVPVVAPDGTVTTNVFAVADVIEAVVLLNVTVF